MRKIFVNICRIFPVAVVCFALFGVSVLAQDKKSSGPMVIGGSVGVDGAYCETAKAGFDLIARVANKETDQVIRPKHRILLLKKLYIHLSQNGKKTWQPCATAKSSGI